MFKGRIENIVDPVIPRITKDLFPQDSIFNDKKILNKGYFRETILESGDTIELKKEFLSEDSSFSKIEILHMSKDSFITECKKDLITVEEAEEEKRRLRLKIGEFSSDNKYEECAVFRDKINILTEVVKSKTI